MTTYRGQVIDYATYHRQTDTYALYDKDHECIAELKTREFLSLPNRKQVEIRSGRHRGTNPKDQRRADRKSGKSWNYDPVLDAWTIYDPGTAQQAASSGLARWKAIWPPEEEKPRPPLKREGIVAGEIVGFRCWRIEEGLLHSVYQTDAWKPGGVLEGRELGDWDSRGIHAWKDPASKHYHNYIRSYLNDTDPGWASFFFTHNGLITSASPRNKRPAMVTGTVFLWGDVVEHERGYRAEFARVRSLDWLYPDETMMGREEEALNGLRALYGVLA